MSNASVFFHRKERKKITSIFCAGVLMTSLKRQSSQRGANVDVGDVKVQTGGLFLAFLVNFRILFSSSTRPIAYLIGHIYRTT